MYVIYIEIVPKIYKEIMPNINKPEIWPLLAFEVPNDN